MYIDPWMFFLLLGSIGLSLLLSTPVSSEQRAWKRAHTQQRRAEWAAWKAQRQAWRRRVFGSHPVLYWGLAWASPLLLGALCEVLR